MDIHIKKIIVANKKEHGLRNQKLSSILFEGKIYYDWTVTTAFYSAIHIVNHKLLPREINAINCDCIEKVKSVINQRGRHAARENLVQEFANEIFVPYKWLDDNSRTSRYITYKTSSDIAAKSQRCLDTIIKYCIPSNN